jgi:phage shock protein E
MRRNTLMLAARMPAALLCAALMLGGAACTRDAPGGTAAATTKQNDESLPDRDPALARKLVGQGALLLDVRTGEEFAERHLDGARNIPVGQMASRISEVEQLTGGDRRRAIVVYCRSGSRSSRAKRMLQQAGFTRVSNLGSIDDWQP